MTVHWKKVYVFISSTFNDMHAERDYLVKQVFPQLAEWCDRRKLRLVDIDLRWGVTEADAAENKRVVQVCLERIDACRPFFLCFLGQRRGWVPARADISAETYARYPELEQYAGEASVTELEILHALVNPLHRGKETGAEYAPAEHSFFYLRQPEYLAVLPEDPPQLRQVYTNEGILDPEERRRADIELGRWRTKAIPSTGRPVRSYSVRWDSQASTPEIRLPLACPSTAEPGSLAWKAALNRWAGQWHRVLGEVKIDDTGTFADPADRKRAEQFNTWLTRGRLTDFTCEGRPLAEIILEDLKAAIQARYPEHTESAEPTPLQRELDQQEQFLTLASEGFIERAGDFDDLDRYVQDDRRGTFFLTAPAGLGKTSLLARWVDRRQSSLAPDETLHYRFIGASDGSTTVDSLLRSLLTEIQELTGKLEGKEIPADPNELRAALPALLEAIGQAGPTVLVLDGLNQLESGMADLAWLPLAPPPGIKVIASFKRGEPQAEAYLERLRAGEGASLAEVRPFEGLDDRRRLVRAYLSQYLKELDERHLETLIRSEGAQNPLYLKVVLAELRVFGAFADLGEKIRSDFGTTPLSAFAGLLRRLENDPAYSAVPPERLVPRVLGWLAHARTGLTAEELGDLLVREGLLPDDETGRQGALGAVHGLLRQLRPYLARREERADFFYESFKLAVLERYVRQEEAAEAHPESRSARDWHTSLAEYFEAQPLRIGPEQAPNRHKLAELAYQQAHAGMGEALGRTLWDYPYIQARLEAHGVRALIADYDLINLPEAGLSGEARRRLGLLQGALRLSAHVLGHDPTQLPSQLTGRLLGREEPEFRNLLEEVRLKTTRPWLRPLTPSLTPPGGPLVFTLSGHRGQVKAVAVTPDGRRAVSASSDLRVWDLEGGMELHALCYIRKVAITPDARRAVVVGEDTALQVWDLEKWEKLCTLQGHTDNIEAVAVTPNGRWAVSASEDGTLNMWDLELREEIRTLRRTGGWIKALAVSRDGRRVLFALKSASGMTLQVWHLEHGDKPQALGGHHHDVHTVIITPDGRRAISVSGIWNVPGELWVWDLERGTKMYSLHGHSKPIIAVDVTPDGQRAISASEDKTLRVWDLKRGLELFTLTGHTGPVTAVKILPDGQRVISGSYYELKVWDWVSGMELDTLRGHSSWITAIALTAGGDRVVSASQDGMLKVWDLRAKAEPRIPAHGAGVNAVVVTPDGRRAVSVGGRTLKVWDTERGTELHSLSGHQGGIGNVVVTADGLRAVSVSEDKTLKVWNLERGVELHTLRGHSYQVYTVDVTPNGRWAVSASLDDTLKVWDLERGVELHTLRGHGAPVMAVKVTPDGRRAVSGSQDKTLKVWDLERGKELHDLGRHRGWIWVVAVTPDGRRAIFASGERDDNRRMWIAELEMWDLERGAQLLILSGHTIAINVVAITPNGQQVVSAGEDRSAKVWDLESGVELHTLRGHNGLVKAAVVTPDGRQAIFASKDETLKVWDLESGHVQATFADEGALCTVSICPDGVTLVAGGNTGIVHFLRLENVTPGPSVVTAWRAPASPLQRLVRRGAGTLAFGCPHCRTWSEVPEAALGTELPCPHCGKVVRLNSFVIEADWRPIAAAWRGES